MVTAKSVEEVGSLTLLSTRKYWGEGQERTGAELWDSKGCPPVGVTWGRPMVDEKYLDKVRDTPIANGFCTAMPMSTEGHLLLNPPPLPTRDRASGYVGLSRLEEALVASFPEPPGGPGSGW